MEEKEGSIAGQFMRIRDQETCSSDQSFLTDMLFTPTHLPSLTIRIFTAETISNTVGIL